MKADPGKPLSDEDVERLISAEMTAGLAHVFGADNIAAERDRNYDYYRGIMNDLPAPAGRSRVVENTVANYIGLMKPNLLRIFTAGRNVAEYVSPKPELQPAVRLVTRFINDIVFRKDNRGELLLGDWAEDALVQSVGSNVNLWGGYINTDLGMLEQAAKGYQSLVVTSDATVSWSNYTTGNIGAAARLKLTGSPAAACALTFPAFQNFISVENATAQTVTIKCSGGTGVGLAAGQKALLYCDGVDYYNAAPTRLGSGDVAVAGKISGVTAGAAATDAVNKAQMETAIANAALPATAGTLRNSLNDTTADYHAGKHTVSATGNLTASFTTDNPGGNEDLLLSLVHTPYWNTPRVVANTDSPVAALDRDIIEVRSATGAVEIDLPATGRVKIVDIDGAAASNNITVDPPGVDTATFDVIDTNYFTGIWQRRPSGTNWDLI